MIFSIQRYIEDYFERRGLTDNDQYAVKVANLYGAMRSTSSERAFRRRFGTIHTVFFRANSPLVRADFEAELLQALDRRFFPKKVHSRQVSSHSQAV